MTHHSYILTYLVGNPTSVQAMAAVQNEYGIDKYDVALANVKVENGALVQMEANLAADDHLAEKDPKPAKPIG